MFFETRFDKNESLYTFPAFGRFKPRLKEFPVTLFSYFSIVRGSLFSLLLSSFFNTTSSLFKNWKVKYNLVWAVLLISGRSADA